MNCTPVECREKPPGRELTVPVLETIDAEIAELEIALAQLKEQIHTQTSDYVQLQENIAKKETVEKELDEKMERWVYLNDLAEKIAETKNT